MTTPLDQMTDITADSRLEYQARFVWTPLTWSEVPTSDPTHASPTRGTPTTLEVESYQCSARFRQLAATLTLTMKGAIDDATLQAMQINDLVEFSIIIRGNGQTQTVKIGTFFIDQKTSPQDSSGPQGNTWTVELRDGMKFFRHQRYFGRLRPDSIQEPGLSTNAAVACTVQDTGDTITKSLHGLLEGNRAWFTTTANGLTAGTTYYVRNPATNTFQVSLTHGGAIVPITSNGSNTYRTDWVTLTKYEPVGAGYYDYFDGDLFDHTYNWDPLPKPRFRIVSTNPNTPTEVVPNGDSIKVLMNDGIVRVSTEYANLEFNKDGTNPTYALQANYFRYATWEDRFADPTLNLNTPADIIRVLAEWAGFQSDDPTALLYIAQLEEASLPTIFDQVLLADGTDVTDHAANGTSPITFGEVYVGMVGRRFCAIHFATAVASTVDDNYIYEYWNGSAWTPITPDLDTTQGLQQSGEVSWMSSNLAAWAKNSPVSGCREAYWIKVSPFNASYSADVSYLMAGYPLQCEDLRISSPQDKKPEAILEEAVRKVIPPNYRWRTNEDGNLVVGFDVKNVASPHFTADYRVRASLAQTPPHLDDMVTFVVYRGQSRDRLNVGSMMNGARILDLDRSNSDQTYKHLISGTKAYWADQPSPSYDLVFLMDNAAVLPHPYFELDLGQVSGYVDVREFGLYSKGSDSEITVGFTSTFDAAVFDGNPATYQKLSCLESKWNSNQSLTFAVPQDLNRIDIRLTDETNPVGFASPGKELSVQVKTGSSGSWVEVGAVHNALGSGVSDTFSWTNLHLEGVVALRVAVGSGAQAATSMHYLASLVMYGPVVSSLTGTWTATGGTGVVGNLHDADTATGMNFTSLQTGFDIVFASPQTLDVIRLVGMFHGQAQVDYQEDGSTTWVPSVLIAETQMAVVSYDVNWTNVKKVRFRVSKLSAPLELSAIQVEVTTALANNVVNNGRWYIEYKDASSVDWEPLCSEADGCEFTSPMWEVTKSSFGDELYVEKLRFTLLAWGQASTGDRVACISQIKVWAGDTYYGKAILGMTYPFNTAADLDLQARLGWKSEVLPVDPTAYSQDLVDYRALAVLGDRISQPGTTRLEVIRPDARIGYTVHFPDAVKTQHGLPYSDYIIAEIGYQSGNKQDSVPIVEVQLVP